MLGPGLGVERAAPSPSYGSIKPLCSIALIRYQDTL